MKISKRKKINCEINIMFLKLHVSIFVINFNFALAELKIISANFLKFITFLIVIGMLAF